MNFTHLAFHFLDHRWGRCILDCQLKAIVRDAVLTSVFVAVISPPVLLSVLENSAAYALRG